MKILFQNCNFGICVINNPFFMCQPVTVTDEDVLSCTNHTTFHNVSDSLIVTCAFVRFSGKEAFFEEKDIRGTYKESEEEEIQFCLTIISFELDDVPVKLCACI